MNNYVAVIGLEIHIQLKTKSRMFGNASNDVWQTSPNSITSPVDIGLPGALPVPNKEAIRYTQQFGYVLECTINKQSKFDRKNYFYPDLPKGYQISQYDEPFCSNGLLDIKVNNQVKTIRIRRIHLEEDTGKSLHIDGRTLLDFNRSGTPLMELVTEPDFASADEASEFAKIIQEAVVILGISDADMEKGNMRLEANISVKKQDQSDLPNYRVEVKNINSFKFMRNAINYEIDRQIKALEIGEILNQETRGWDEKKGITFIQRSKENAHDYRYFPEPDIPPFVFDDEYINELSQNLPKMPWVYELELIESGVNEPFANQIAHNQEKNQMYLQLVRENPQKSQNEIAKVVINRKSINEMRDYLNKQLDQSVSSKNTILTEDQILAVINNFPDAVNDLKAGKSNALQFLIGQIMREHKGQVDAATLPSVLIRLIGGSN